MSHETNQDNSMRERVLRVIESRGIKMRPQWHFTVRTLFVLGGVVLAALSLLYLVSLIVFTLRQSGTWIAPQFGWGGCLIFLRSLPPVLVSLTLVFLVALELLVRRYRFAWRYPLLLSLLGILLLVGLGSAAVARTTFHDQLWRNADAGRLPLAGPMYRSLTTELPEGVFIGEVLELLPEGFRLNELRRGAIEVRFVSPDRRRRPSSLSANDRVVVFGEWRDEVVAAIGVRHVPSGSPSSLFRRCGKTTCPRFAVPPHGE